MIIGRCRRHKHIRLILFSVSLAPSFPSPPESMRATFSAALHLTGSLLRLLLFPGQWVYDGNPELFFPSARTSRNPLGRTRCHSWATHTHPKGTLTDIINTLNKML